ncbi:MAG: hypothetical protein IT305_01540 [Chloroflexi bacterium]|nr:hypothetical protein [Chloroflexota bacterium]
MKAAFGALETERPGRSANCRRQRAGRHRLGYLVALLVVLAGSMPTTISHAADAPTVGGIQLLATRAAGWPVYYDADVPPSAVQNVVDAIELSLAEIPRVTGLPAPSGTVTTFVLANRDRFRLAIAENRGAGAIVDDVSERSNGLAMWTHGEMRIFLKMPEVQSPASAAGFVSHELAHLTVAQTARFRPMTQWLNEGYAEIVRYEVVRADFPDAAEMLDRYHHLGLASGIQRIGGPLPWPDLVTSSRFSGWTRRGYGQTAYGQSALMVQVLLDRYGADSIPNVFRAIGQGASPTDAFVGVFGSFASLVDAFDAAVADLPAQFPPGLYPLAAHPRADGIPALALVAGDPGETGTVDVYAGDTLVEHQDFTLDPVGFTRVTFGEAVGAGAVVVRVTTPSLGLLETSLTIEPAAQFRQRAAPTQLPPAQVPKVGGVLPSPTPVFRLCQAGLARLRIGPGAPVRPGDERPTLLLRPPPTRPRRRPVVLPGSDPRPSLASLHTAQPEAAPPIIPSV